MWQQGVWDWHVHTAISKIDNQKGPTVKQIFKCSRENHTYMLRVLQLETEVQRGYICSSTHTQRQ